MKKEKKHKHFWVVTNLDPFTYECKECGTEVTNCGTEAITITCSECVSEMMRQYDQPKTKNNNLNQAKGYPKGWRFLKEFVHASGLVYHKGVEQPQLKGTLSATVIESSDKKKLSKKEKEELKEQILLQIAMTRGQVKKATLKKDISKGMSDLKKLERQLKKVQ
jgi:hypothetical protein